MSRIHHLLRTTTALLGIVLLASCGGGGDSASSSASSGAAALAVIEADGTVHSADVSTNIGGNTLRAMAAATATVANRTALRGHPIRVIGYAYYNTLTCQIIDTGTLTAVTSPQYGSLTYEPRSSALSSGPCSGTTLPFITAFYTWNKDHPPEVRTDPFTLEFTASGITPSDTDWTVAFNDDDPGGNQGTSDPDVPDPSCPKPGCLAGNPIHTGTGNKVGMERDLTFAPSTHLSLVRYYNSTDATATPLGVGWRSEWHKSLRVDAGAGTVTFTREDGRTYNYLPPIAGTLKFDVARPDILSRLTAVRDASNAQIGWSLTRMDDSVERYGMNGHLLSVTARNGQVTSLNYAANGNLASVVGPFGHTLQFAYSGPNIASVTGPDGAVVRYVYDANNNLQSVTYPDGKTKAYVYENAGYPHALTGVIDELGVRYATYSYDSSGRGLTSEHAGGVSRISLGYSADGSTTVTNSLGYLRTTTHRVDYGIVRPALFAGARFAQTNASAYAYAASGLPDSITDWNGNVTALTHDGRGNETSRTDASGTSLARTITTTWLSNFHLASKIVEPNRTIALTYDASGNVLTRTVTADGTSRTWTFTYSSIGQVLTAKDPLGHVTTYAYGPQGNLSSVTDALSHVTSYGNYDGSGRPGRMVDPNGLVITLAYDARGRLTTRNVGGEVTTVAYDAAGNFTSVTRPDGSKLTMGYDAAHRLTSSTDSLGNRIVYTLDSEGNRTKVTVYDTVGNINRSVSYAYDDANRLIKVTGAASQTTSLTRDGNGNVLTVTDPLGAITTSTYDALNRLATSQDAKGGVTSLGYDAMDRVTSVTDPRALITSYVYSGFGDLLKTISPDSGTTTRTFDANGNLLTSTDARGAFNTRAYDALNRLTSILYSGGKHLYEYDTGPAGIGHLTRVSGNTDSTALAYDLWGRLLSKQQTVGSTTLTESRAYDAGGRLASITYPSGMVVAYGYDAAGQASSLNVNNAGFLSSITHEPFGPARGWSWSGQAYSRTHDADGRLSAFTLGAATRTLGYDAASQITSYSDSNGAAQSFGYDPLGRLTSFTSGSASQVYDYDADGNRLSLTSSGATSNYTINAASNQLASRMGPAAGYVYDQAGNLTSSGSLSFSYDPLGRMTASLNGSLRSARTLYTTSGLGQRLQKAGPSGTTNFLYGEGSELHGEYGSASSQETVYLDGMPFGLMNNGQLLRIYADQLGAPRVIADASGSQLWVWDGDPFGNVAPTGTLTFNQRFPGQYADAETGLHFNHARYYDPKIGRYVQSDPIGLVGGIDGYTFTSDSPVTKIDPYGRRDYSSQETKEILGRAYTRATSGWLSGLVHIYVDNAPLGEYDYAGNSVYKHDTFCFNGSQMTALEFGNFVAGYQSAAHDETTYIPGPPALLITYIVGVGLHTFGATAAINDPFDLTGWAEIKQGALAIPGQTGFKLLFDGQPSERRECSCK